MNRKIQTIVMPNIAFGAPEEMYVRKKNNNSTISISKNEINFQKGGIISFDTFYNSITIETWKINTNISDLQINLRGKGRFLIRIGHHKIGQSHRWLDEKEISLNENLYSSTNISSWNKLDEGMLYFSLKALEESSLLDANYSTKTQIARNITLGIIITHFNRKPYTIASIKRIKKELLDDPHFKENIKLIIIDNSKNISKEEGKGATIIPNRNLGGSGGFTRGLLFLKDQGNFSHCLFMDDDAFCEIESIRRAYNIISYSNDRQLAIAGSFLRERYPFHLYEKGARFSKGFWLPINKGLDMRKVPDLLESEKRREKADYGAWWFFLFDINHPKHLAFPFFVRGDDVQFGLQNNFRIITQNGISCWGEDFEVKEGALSRYLASRATITISIAYANATRHQLLKISFLWFTSSLFSHNYASARSIIMAIEHTLKGPDFFQENIDIKDIRSEINNFSTKEKLIKTNLEEIEYENPKINDSFVRRAFRYITLNGFLLPKFALKKSIVYQDKSFRAVFRQIFRYRRVLYYHEASMLGYITEFNRKSFFYLSFKFISSLIKLIIKYRTIKKKYSLAFNTMTTEEFWREIYHDINNSES